MLRLRRAFGPHFVVYMPNSQPLKDKDSYSWVEPMKIFARLSMWIVVPVLAGLGVGRWLDRKNDSEPKWFLICIGLAFVISMVMLVKETLREYKKIDKLK